jgi:hypothetical protein
MRMDLHEELTRPLGLAAPARRRRTTAGWLAGAVLTGLAGAGVWTFGGRPWMQPPQAGPQIVAETRAGAGNEAKAVSDEKNSGPDRDAIVASVPDGTLTPKVPLPRPKRQEAGQGLAHLPDPALIERGASGAIPKRSADGRRAMDVYSRQPATEGNFGVARVVLIVGGLGMSQSGSQDAVRKLPAAVNLAFAPYGNSLARWMQEARRTGHEILLQVPMEPFDYPANNPGPHTLKTGAVAEENLANLHWAMSRITNYVGVMNFLGGKLLADPAAAGPVLDEIAARGLLFVDDGSMANTSTGELAARSRLPFARAHVRIDAVRTRRDIAARLEELAGLAKRTGLAIGVASAFPDSIEMIGEFARNAAKLGIEITPVSAIVSDPERLAKG